MLHYKTFESAGPDADWVAFIHGAGGSSSIWYKQLRDFQKYFRVLLVDLRGHGDSKNHQQQKQNQHYTFESISAEVVEVLDHLKIKESHFIGISLGTIIIKEIADRHPERVAKMVLGGAIVKLNFRSQVLMRVGVWFKSVVPYLLLYKLFAWIIMPRRSHRESRSLFVREAKKLYQKEFIRWFKLTAEINALLVNQRQNFSKHATLYLMGEEDHMFLPSIRKLVSQAPGQRVQLSVIEASGHVVNVDQPEHFNRQCIAFLQAPALA